MSANIESSQSSDRLPRWQILLRAGLAAILFLPLLAMQFTNEVAWGLGDFIVAAILLAALCMAIEYTVSRSSEGLQSILFGGIVMISIVLLWAEMAVGIFGSPLAGS